MDLHRLSSLNHDAARELSGSEQPSISMLKARQTRTTPIWYQYINLTSTYMPMCRDPRALPASRQHGSQSSGIATIRTFVSRTNIT